MPAASIIFIRPQRPQSVGLDSIKLADQYIDTSEQMFRYMDGHTLVWCKVQSNNHKDDDNDNIYDNLQLTQNQQLN